MGVTCTLYLSMDIRDSALSAVAGALMGATRLLPKLDSSGSFYFDVSPTKLVPDKEYSYTIWGKGGQKTIPLVRLGRYNHIPGGHVYRGHLWLYFSGGASAPTIALFRGIAKIFGGIVALRDDKPEEYEEYPRPKETRDAGGFYPADDKYWNTCQRYLYDNTKALALNDLRLADTVAAYKIDDDEEEYGVDWIDSLLSRGKYGAKKKP